MKLSEIYKSKKDRLKNMAKNGFKRPTLKEVYTAGKKYVKVPK